MGHLKKAKKPVTKRNQLKPRTCWVAWDEDDFPVATLDTKEGVVLEAKYQEAEPFEATRAIELTPAVRAALKKAKMMP